MNGSEVRAKRLRQWIVESTEYGNLNEKRILNGCEVRAEEADTQCEGKKFKGGGRAHEPSTLPMVWVRELQSWHNCSCVGIMSHKF